MRRVAGEGGELRIWSARPGPPFDLVFLRNVLIYFRAQSQRRVVEAVARNLAADGYLFLGHSESLWQLSGRLTPIDLGGCFAYRHAAPAASPPPPRAGVAAVPSMAPAWRASRLEAEPEDAAAHALGGLIHDLDGDGEGAIAAYRAALFLRPELYRVRFQLAERLRLGGWRERARAEYRRVLATLREGAGEHSDLAGLLPEHREEVAERCRAALSRL